jgi:hypothetical protein
MSASVIDASPNLKRFGRRAGYVVAIVINMAMLIVAQNILEWGWFPFLTSDFGGVLPWISFSLIATIVVYVVYLLRDSPTVKSTGQIGLNLINLVATYQVWLAFPFDFSAYDFNWNAVVRFLLIVAMVGAGIGALVEGVKLARQATDGKEMRDAHHI